MGLQKCPDCGREVSSDAPTCPGCGKPIAKPKAKTGCATVGCATILVGLLALWLMNLLTPSPPGGAAGPAAPAGPDWVTIKTTCQMTVLSRLKAPSTAKFNWGDRADFTDKDPRRAGLGFLGSVDSQNAFGAMLRTGFRCWMRKDGSVAVEFDK